MGHLPEIVTPSAPLPSLGVADLGRRSDILVSVLLLVGTNPDELVSAFESAWEYLDARYEFFELTIVAKAAFASENNTTIQRLAIRGNTRVLIIADEVSDYRAAVIAANETIGDLVVFWACDEAAFVTLPDLLEAVERSGGSAIARRRHVAGGLLSILSGRTLSAISGYRIDPRVLRSCAHHRAYLTAITRRPDCELSLRFTRESIFDRANRVAVVEIDGGPRPRLLRRFRIILQVLTSSPPRLLRMLTAISLITFLCATMFVGYALVLFATGVDLQPGWLTTSLAIGGATAFTSLSIGAISIGIHQLLISTSGDEPGEIVDDLTNSDLFADFDIMNIDTKDNE